MNNYNKLRPSTDIESCTCKTISGLILVDLLTYNPIHCFNCKNEIDPEILKLPKPLVDEIASWFRSYQALYALWLDSGEYESYAQERLLDKHGQVNLEGMRIAKQLSNFQPSYYLRPLHERGFCSLARQERTERGSLCFINDRLSTFLTPQKGKITIV